MDGKHQIYSLKHLIEEDASSGFWDNYLGYQFLNEAANNWTIRTKCLRNTQSITTVASTAAYDLNPDYLGMYLKDDYNNFFIKYYDGTNYSFITQSDYEDVILSDNTTAQSIPSTFSIRDKSSLPTRVTGTASANGAASGGECTLTVAASAFTDVYAGDNIHNTTDGSMGMVLSKTSNLALVTALFGGTNNDWSTSDAFVIQPQGRKQIVVDPLSLTAAHTILVYYLQKPAPVYSDYGMFRFDYEVSAALVKYAAWLYKYRDKDPNYGDKWYQYYENQITVFNRTVNNTIKKNKFSFSFKAV